MVSGVSIIEAQVSAAANGWRLDRALADAVPTLSRERLKALISSGAVSDRTGALLRDPAKKAVAGDILSVAVPDPTPAHNEAQDIPLVVAFEDEHLIVIDKPAGLVVHPAAGNLDGTLVNALLHHRIDKDTSGLMVAAKTDRTHVGLARQFADHSIDRRYKAIVSGRLTATSGTIDAPLARSPQNRKKIAIVQTGKRAITHWRQLRQLRDAALVECKLETGRTHQVRVHMASIGHPLLGDPVYGRTKQAHRKDLETLNFRRQALHAAVLGFIHPITREALSFESEMPADMRELFDTLNH
jgi:23S rRNA pseudouridine1911/1915/1917 synthase